MEITLKVKEVAKAKGYGQGSLSRAANVDLNTIKRIFRDPTREVVLSTIVKIAWALEVSINDLVEVKGGPHDKPGTQEA